MVYSVISFSKAILVYFLGLKSNKKLYYSGYCLIKKRTFALPDSSRYDRIIVLKVLFRTLKNIFFNPFPDFSSVKNSDRIIYDDLFANKILRTEYLKYCKNHDIELFVSRDILLSEKGTDKIYVSFMLVLIAVPLTIWGIFSKDRVNIATILPEIIQTKNLLAIIKNRKIKILHWFCIYEKDANIGALIFQYHGVEVVKHLSPTPLTAQNRIIISDTLAIESAYHKDEISYLRDTMFIRETEKYFPEKAHSYLEIYRNKNLECADPVISFYSHGGWLRKRLNSENALFGNFEAELELINILSEFLSANNKIKLIVYPHPKERKMEFIDETATFYKDKFQLCNYECVLSHERKTYLEFHKVNIAISTVSTVLFERLFCGYKSLFFTKGLNDFPIPQSSLSNICTQNKNEMFNLILKNLPLSNNTFFFQNKLTEYPLNMES